MTAGFYALGFDPAPGDPDAVLLLSREARQVASQVDALGQELRRLGEVRALWQGTAAQEFVRLLDQLPASLRTTAEAFGILAEQLSGWEATLRQLQTEARTLEVQAQAARDRRAAPWSAGQPQTSGPRDLPTVAFGPSTGGLSGAPTPSDAPAGQVRAALLEAEWVAILNRARSLSERTRQEGDRVAAAVRRATTLAPPPPGLFEQLGDWFGEVDRAVGNFVNNNIENFYALADAASGLGLLVMLIPGAGLAPGMILGGLGLLASGALARYADGSTTDVALAVAGVGLGSAAGLAGRLAAGARAKETGTAVQPLASMWTMPVAGAGEMRWRGVQMGVNLGLALGLGTYSNGDMIGRRQGRKPPSPDDPRPRLQLVLAPTAAPPAPVRGGATSADPSTPSAGGAEPGRRAEPRHLWPTAVNGRASQVGGSAGSSDRDTQIDRP